MKRKRIKNKDALVLTDLLASTFHSLWQRLDKLSICILRFFFRKNKRSVIIFISNCGFMLDAGFGSILQLPQGRRKPFGWQTKANANAKANYLVEKEVSKSVCKVKVSYDTLQISQFEFL